MNLYALYRDRYIISKLGIWPTRLIIAVANQHFPYP